MIKNRKLILLLLVTTVFFTPLIAQKPDADQIAKWRSGTGHLKATQTERELLDSVVYLETYDGVIYGGDKQAWEYGPDGRSDNYSWYYWDAGAATWSGLVRVDSTFNAAGKLTMLIKDGWDSNSKQWIPKNKTEISYNTDGEQILYADYFWNAETKQWVYSRKSESTHSYTKDGMHIVFSINYTYDEIKGVWMTHHRNEMNYDAKGNQTLYNASFLDSASNTWVFKKGSFKFESTFNEQGKITFYSYYIWDSEKNQWKGQDYLVEAAYDSNGNMTSDVSKTWDDASNQWINIHKTENSYNEHGDITGVNTSDWNNVKSLWVVNTKLEFFYNANGNLSKEQVLLQDSVSNEWYINAKDEYTYDANNRETLKEQYKRNDKGQLALEGKQETSYDTFGNVTLTASYNLDTLGNFVKNYDTKYTFNESGDKLIEEATSYYYESGPPYILKSTYYYSLHSVSSINKVKETPGSFVYPGLFTDKLSFQLDNTNDQYVFDLFNTQGQKVLSTQVKHSETINVADLPGGVYLYTLSLDNKVLKGKLIKK